MKTKKKRIANGSNSSRKNRVKSKQSNYQPISGTIDLVSRNERWVTQVSNDNSKHIDMVISRQASHKRTSSIETSERSDNQSKNRFLVSKKYSKRMVDPKLASGKDSIKSYLGSSLKYGTSTSIAKYQNNNNTNIIDAYTPTSTTSNKINIRGSLLARKWIGVTKKRIETVETDISKQKERRKKKVKDFKILKEPGSSKVEHYNTEGRSPVSKASTIHRASINSTKIRSRLTPVSISTLSTSKRLESHFGHNDLYSQIIKNRKDKHL